MTPNDLRALAEKYVDVEFPREVGLWRWYESASPAAVLMLLDALEAAQAEVTDGPTWDVISLRSTVVALTVERDEARGEVERLRSLIGARVADANDEAQEALGRSLHYEARAEHAEAVIEGVRALCSRDHYSEWGVHAGECIDEGELLAVLDGGTDPGKDTR